MLLKPSIPPPLRAVFHLLFTLTADYSVICKHQGPRGTPVWPHLSTCPSLLQTSLRADPTPNTIHYRSRTILSYFFCHSPLPHMISQFLSSNPIVCFLSIHKDTVRLFFHQHSQSENCTCHTSGQILSLQAIFPLLSVQPLIQFTISLFLLLCSTALFVMQLDSRYSSLLSSLPRLCHIFLPDFFPLTAFLYFLTPLPSLLVVFSPSRGYIKHLLGSCPFHFSCTFQVIW